MRFQNVLINDDFLDLYTQINQYLRPLEVIHGGIRGRLGREHPKGERSNRETWRSDRRMVLVPGFTLMDDLDLKSLDTKSLHALFQRDPFKILGRLVEEGGYDFIKALQKWDLEEHGSLTYSIYVIDFPSAVRVNDFSCRVLHRTLLSPERTREFLWIKLCNSFSGIIWRKSRRKVPWAMCKCREKEGSLSWISFSFRQFIGPPSKVKKSWFEFRFRREFILYQWWRKLKD